MTHTSVESFSCSVDLSVSEHVSEQLSETLSDQGVILRDQIETTVVTSATVSQSVVTSSDSDVLETTASAVLSEDIDASATPAPASGFSGFGFGPELLEALAAIGYQEPSPIQKAAIPELMLGRDLVGQAQTGTGKTAAFALPLLAALDPAQRTPRCWC